MKEILKDTIDKLQEHIKKLEQDSAAYRIDITKLRNRLQLIKAQADVGFV